MKFQTEIKLKDIGNILDELKSEEYDNILLFRNSKYRTQKVLSSKKIDNIPSFDPSMFKYLSCLIERPYEKLDIKELVNFSEHEGYSSIDFSKLEYKMNCFITAEIIQKEQVYDNYPKYQIVDPDRLDEYSIQFSWDK